MVQSARPVNNVGMAVDSLGDEMIEGSTLVQSGTDLALNEKADNLSAEGTRHRFQTDSTTTTMDDAMSRQLDDPECCAICFDPVWIPSLLPCACKVAYCHRCYDRSLAQSFNFCGQARCPTCRGPVHVDYDTESASLVFSCETEVPEQTEVDVRRFMEQRVGALRKQALPVQVRLLKQHAAENSEVQQLARNPQSCLRLIPDSDLRRHIDELQLLRGTSSRSCVEEEPDPNALANQLWELVASDERALSFINGGVLAACSKTIPRCVCGSHLKYVSGRDRVRMSLRSNGFAEGSIDFEALVDRYLGGGNPCCFCDLCEEHVPTTNAVWTCENENSTILHATSYDICDACFSRYAASTNVTPAA